MHIRILALGIVFGIPLQELVGQSDKARTLRPATARLEEEFVRIAGIRELSDGRILVADAGEKRIVVVDFERQSVSRIGREGRGPGEYAQVSLLAPLGRDSTLMPDPANGRWLLLVEDHIAETIPPDHPAYQASRGALRGADQRGHVLIVTPPPLREDKQKVERGDSVQAVLVTRSSGRADTVGRLRAAPLSAWTEVDNAGKVRRAGLTYPPFSVGEEPLLFPDGWLAFARLDPYRVDWRTPEGKWVRGASLPFMEQPVDQRERRAYRARQAARSGREPAPVPDDAWPATIPPFQPSPLLAVPDGGVLILRTPTAGRPGHRYDQVDRSGRLMGSIELGSDARIAGIGWRGAYVVTTDEGGIERLRRHPWP